MLKNYLKIALRNIRREKVLSSINFLGLSVAFIAAILMFLTAQFELSFDDFQANKDRIYKLYFKVSRPEKVDYGAAMPIPMQPSIKAEFPAEVKHATRRLDGGMLVRIGDKSFESDVNYVDPDYLYMFSFELLAGSRETALNQLDNIVLREKQAKSFFGDVNPIGKTLMADIGRGMQPFTVAGILADAPDNSTIEGDCLIRFEAFPEYQENKDRWTSKNHDVYIQLAEGVDYLDFERRLMPFTAKYYQKDIDFAHKAGFQGDERGEVISTRLLPFADEHFNKMVGSHSIDPYIPYLLLGIALLVILIASINFINLSIARSLGRAKEVGMRKALGALRAQVVGQFWGEALLISLGALVVGLAGAYALMPEYNALMNGEIKIVQLLRPEVLATLLLTFILVTALAGGYPAWIVSRFNTVEVLKGKVKSGIVSGGIRNSLIIVQFVISVGLIACTLVVWSQINYLRNKPLGFDREQVVSIPIGNGIDGYRLLNHFRNELSGQTSIVSITGADNNLGSGRDNSGFKSVFGFDMEGKNYQTNGLNVDFDYVETLGLDLVAGRSFNRQFSTDSTSACIINETMARQLGGGKNLIGKTVAIDGGKTIIGIVRDYHFESLHRKVESMTLFFNKPFGIYYLFVKINGNPAQAMQLLERTYLSFAPKSEFLGSFLDENTSRQYKKEERIAKVFMTAAGLAILLCCVGLFAIALMVIRNRTKEIGIRKVLGADVSSLVGLLSKDFLKLVLIAIVMAVPLAWYTMDAWLSDFPYRVPVAWWSMAAAGAGALLIALATVSIHAVRAALRNPVTSLRSE
ncbi:ABC transporter permease [Salmonirosea aquatica]|uniref:FtsX-like permease family protein n=1 Tax=Salmonirosea aquatica TaxID=2654236 RepID=A0A7C9F9P3_9BACT|nr:FtsX-like permease family protein [Cytophagaceae bacterium SJW1-29]